MPLFACIHPSVHYLYYSSCWGSQQESETLTFNIMFKRYIVCFKTAFLWLLTIGFLCYRPNRLWQQRGTHIQLTRSNSLNGSAAIICSGHNDYNQLRNSGSFPGRLSRCRNKANDFSAFLESSELTELFVLLIATAGVLRVCGCQRLRWH